MTNYGQTNLLEDHLILASGSKLVLAPFRSKAVTGIEQLLWLWQADGVNLGLQVEVLHNVKQGPSCLRGFVC